MPETDCFSKAVILHGKIQVNLYPVISPGGSLRNRWGSSMRKGGGWRGAGDENLALLWLDRLQHHTCTLDLATVCRDWALLLIFVFCCGKLSSSIGFASESLVNLKNPGPYLIGFRGSCSGRGGREEEREEGRGGGRLSEGLQVCPLQSQRCEHLSYRHALWGNGSWVWWLSKTLIRGRLQFQLIMLVDLTLKWRQYMAGKLSFWGKGVMGQILAVFEFPCLIKKFVSSKFSFI